MLDLSLYVHVPYCESKCPYCDFNSYASPQRPEATYADAVIAELQHYAAQPKWQGRVQTIFLGGGTPSLFAPASIAKILGAVGRLWPATSSAETGASTPTPTAATEVTIEANPGTVTASKLRDFRAAGVNRISFGAQSFHDRHLRRLGRIHSAAEATGAIDLAREAGFDNLSLDLIFAVPEQTVEEWRTDLRTAISVAPDHLATYGLTVEEGTPFHDLCAKGELERVPEEVEIDMFTSTREILGGAGYVHYEISNYARPGRECRHNLNYWHRGRYLGVGAGAHSFAPAPSPGERWSNERNPDTYVRRVQEHGQARVFEETLSSSQARGEFAFLGLRLCGGFDTAEFANHFGLDFVAAFPHVRSLERDGLVVMEGSRLHLSERGLLLADSVFATFL